jgi:transposase InsO family protein
VNGATRGLTELPTWNATTGPRLARLVRAGDDEIFAEIRGIIGARPTYGYRRVTALLLRARPSLGRPPLSYKRTSRPMRMASLLLPPFTGRRVIRAHEGLVIALASNQRWASDGFEIPCWDGEIVRIAFAIDTHDREIMASDQHAGIIHQHRHVEA